MRNGRQVLEVLLMKRRSDGKYTLPGGFMKGSEIMPAHIKELFVKSLDNIEVWHELIFVICIAQHLSVPQPNRENQAARVHDA